jgi:AcrR family transcriptional regulator
VLGTATETTATETTGAETTGAGAASNGGPASDRRARRRAATKSEILDAAWALARSEGLTNFSMRDVATRVGMQAPSLYQYFDSKHAIYDAMFGQAAQEALETVCADLPGSSDPSDRREVLVEVARRVFDFGTGDPARMQLLFQRTIPGFEPSPAAYAPSVEMSTRISSVLTGLGFTDPDTMDLFTAVVSGLINQQMSNDPGGTRWGKLLERSVDMFLDHMDSHRSPGTNGRIKSSKNSRKSSTRTTTTKRGR